MHPVNTHDLARRLDADLRDRASARHRAHPPRRPRGRALREAVGYRLVVAGWRLLDPGVGPGINGAAAPPARTAGPRPA
jgi:hypothetical protein